jgi:hypothetical protein
MPWTAALAHAGARGAARRISSAARSWTVSAQRWRVRRRHRDLHAGSAAVLRGGRGGGIRRARSIRQHPRDRRLVGERREGRAEDGGADRHGGVAPAPFETVSLESEGVTLGPGPRRRGGGGRAALAETLDITVLLLPPGRGHAAARRRIFPVLQGRIRARGHLGAFELTVDDYAAPAPSSRAGWCSRRRATGRCRAAIWCST